MVRRTDTRARLLESTASVFRSQGYHATGLNQLLDAGGAPRGSLYFHFPGGKEQLAAEAIVLASAHLCELLRSVLAGEGPLLDRLQQVVELLGQGLADSDFRAGCPLSTVALDAGADSEPIRQACADGYASWCALLTEQLAGHGVADADRLATMILASVEGGLLLARIQRDLAPLRAVADYLRLIIEKELA